MNRQSKACRTICLHLTRAERVACRILNRCEKWKLEMAKEKE
jgi:hypothetical protein